MANKKITELMAGTPTRDSLIESATDVGGTTVSRKFEVGAVVDLNNVQIALEYDNTSTYAYGDYCIYEGVLYRCTTAITVAEAWTSAHWTAVMVTGEYKRVRIMTKAQFDLLSNDEKDGFIYVSDYPTKIQDIDNVSLTTSDNNKLLGVSVIDGEIIVGAVSYLPTMGGKLTSSNTDLTGSQNSPNTLFTETITLNSKSLVWFQYYAIIKTTSSTGRLTLVVDNVDVSSSDRDLTDWMFCIGTYNMSLNAGVHTVALKLTSTNPSATATLKAWNTYGYTYIATPTL